MGEAEKSIMEWVLGKLGPGQLGPGQLSPGQLGPGQLFVFRGRQLGLGQDKILLSMNPKTPPSVWHKYQDKIKNVELYIYFENCALPQMFSTQIRIESTMLNCTHILDMDENLLSRNPKIEHLAKLQFSGTERNGF